MRYEAESLVPYTNPACTNSRLVTNRIVYSTTIDLDPGSFSDPEGYYMVWERCCRNNIVTNIILPDQTGQTFYLEFPAIRQNNEEFRNSSPQLFPPLSDYACVDRLYYVDFRGFDPDGDSLVYRLATPLNSSQYQPLPTPTPAPHPEVSWVDGVDSENQVPGNPTLNVSEKGFLTVTPSEEGLFVFSVQCEEYRNGKLIGKVIRDFQLLVIDCPKPGNPPEIQVKYPGKEIYTSEIDTIVLSADDDKCFDFRIKDKDGGETITMRAEAVNFEANVQSILSAEIGYLNSTNDSLEIQVCLPDCPYLQNEPFVIDIIAQDNTCPLPLMDTMRIAVLVEPPINNGPIIESPLLNVIDRTFSEGEMASISFSATDEDLDSLLLYVEGVDFLLDEYLISIDTINYEEGRIDFELNWDLDCEKNPFVLKNEFQLKFFVEDKDKCDLDNRDSVIVNIRVDLPDNNMSEILVNGDNSDKNFVVRVGDRLSFNIEALDADPRDSLFLKAIGLDFDIAELGFPFESLKGVSNLSSEVDLNIDCNLIKNSQGKSYDILLISEDGDKCKEPNSDTLKVNLTILPPLNTLPEVYIGGAVNGDTVHVDAGSLLDLEIIGFDQDNDSISMHLIERDNAEELGILFNDQGGEGNIVTNFTWQTDCSNLGEEFASSSFFFSIVVQDHKCVSSGSDTLHLKIKVEDKDIDFDFLPPNVFTPNNDDDINPSFYIQDLPGDNCRRQFRDVLIFNRNGKKVYSSNDRSFEWYGSDQPSGVYYYLISYSDLSVKGTITLLR